MTTRRIHSGLNLLAGLLLGALLMLVGLAQAGRLAPARPEVLVALAQTLEVEHQRVDVLLKQKDVPGAIAALEALRKLQWPDRAAAGEAGEQLRHDVYGRLLRLRLDHPKVDPRTPDQLAEIAKEGLGDDYASLAINAFTARLVALRGEVAELRGDDEAALLAYEEALTMNRGLLQQALAGAAQ
jgi:hypothetical protein